MKKQAVYIMAIFTLLFGLGMAIKKSDIVNDDERQSIEKLNDLKLTKTKASGNVYKSQGRLRLNDNTAFENAKSKKIQKKQIARERARYNNSNEKSSAEDTSEKEEEAIIIKDDSKEHSDGCPGCDRCCRQQLVKMKKYK
jgi:hypothetical protein